jgi:hypothetical protein
MRRRMPHLAIVTTAPGRKPSRRYRPECAPLEGRTLLSTFTVTNLHDSGAGSLRAAISAAEAAPGNGTVMFAPGLAGAINLGSPLAISGNLSIQGPGASAIALDGQYAIRDLVVNAGATASISGLTVTGGFGYTGGGLLNNGTLTLANMTFKSNDAGDGGHVTGDLPGTGGAIDNVAGAVLTISSSQFTGNYAYNGQGGGAITSAGSLTMSTSAFTGNTVRYGDIGGPDGAALYNTATAILDLCTFTANSFNSVDSTGTLTLRRSTITGDSMLGLVCSGNATIDSCTLSGNGEGEGSSVYSDGGVCVARGGMVTLVNSTIADNHGAGVIVIRGISPTDKPTVVAIAECTIAGNTGTATSTDTTVGAGINVVSVGSSTQISLHNTILAGNTVVPSGGTAFLHDLYTGTAHPPKYISLGYNLIQAPGGVTFTGTTAGNIYGVNPELGPLANNGGPTQTMALLAGSGAINAGDPNLTGLPPFDQRGIPRVAHGQIDIGAFEVR